MENLELHLLEQEYKHLAHELSKPSPLLIEGSRLVLWYPLYEGSNGKEGFFTYSHVIHRQWINESYKQKDDCINAAKKRYGDVFTIGQLSMSDFGSLQVINQENNL